MAKKNLNPAIISCIENHVWDMYNNNEKIPVPISIKTYSGKFMACIPPDVHRKIALMAAESGASLNQLKSSKLSQ